MSKTRSYEIKLTTYITDKLDDLIAGGLYPSVDSMFLSMSEWWLNQPSVQDKLCHANPSKYKKVKYKKSKVVK